MIDENSAVSLSHLSSSARDQTLAPHSIGFELKGKTNEYFRIWIVNIFLSIITLGIYSAWAKVRTKRYFYGNTLLDNSFFDYFSTHPSTQERIERFRNAE